METEAIRQYLGILKNAFSQRAGAADVLDSEEGPVLICTVASPFDENDEIAYQVSLHSADEGFVATEIMIFMFTDISEDKFRDLSLLINRLNQFISLGSFRLYEDNGTVMLYQGMIFDEAMQTAKVTELIFATIQSLESAMTGLGEFIDRALKGENMDLILADLHKEAE